MKISQIDKLYIEQNSHNPKITKRVMIRNGQIPNLTNFSQGVFPKGEGAEAHSHSDMYEVFFTEKGSGIIKINGKPYKITPGTCLTVEPGDTHEVINSSDEDLVLTYFGIEVKK